MASSTPTYFQIPNVQQAFTSAQRPEDELDLAAAFIALDFDDQCDTDHEEDESEDPHAPEVNKIMDQLLQSKRVGGSQAVPARPAPKRYIPDTPHDPSVAKVAQKLRESDADLDAVEYLTDEVWPEGKITLEGLMAPMGAIELRVFGLPAGSAKYLGLFRQQDRTGVCRLCPLDNSIPFMRPESGLFHITRHHFDMGYSCRCGW